MLSNTYAIRAGAQQFASVAEGMRQKAQSIDQNATTLMEKWSGKAADAYDSVSEFLGNDIQTASNAFEQAAHALHVLAGQLDQVNSLRQQADQLSSQIQSLEWSLSSADDHHRASISSEISQLSYRRSHLQYEADSLEHHANAAASASFDEIAGMVNRLHFYHGTHAATSSHSSVLDKVGHFFSGLWHKTEKAAEDAYQTVSNEFHKVGDEIEHALDDFQAKVEQGGWLGGTVGFIEGLGSSLIDTIKFAAEMNPMNIIQNAILHPEATYEKAKAIFTDLEHPVQTAERLWDGAKVLWSTAKQSFDQDIIHGNAYTRSKWTGYAVGVIAQAIATDGAAAAAKGAGVAGEGVEVAAEGIEIGQKITPTELAQSWQGKGAYPGVDKYRDITLKKGTIIYRGEPFGSEYFSTANAIKRSGNDAKILFEGLQVQKHPQFGYRPGMTAYIVNEDLPAAFGLSKANPQYGRGNLPQIFVPDANELIETGILKPIYSQRLINFR